MAGSMDGASGEKRLGSFYFSCPDDDPSLSPTATVAVAMGAMASRLVAEERTLCDHPGGRPENVGEHSFMLAKVAVELARSLYPDDLNPARVALMAICHDDPEAYVGDTPTYNITSQGLAEKAAREAEGVAQLVREYESIAPGYVSDIQCYESQMDPEARFVRVVDKMMPLLTHLANDGVALQKKFTRESYIRHWEDKQTRLLAEYPEYEGLIQLEVEIARWLAERYLVDISTLQPD